MSVKGYDREIFVGASKCKANLLFHGEVRLDFFAISADNEGAMKQEPLTNLVQRVRYIGNADIVSIAVGDFDGDKYNNEVAVMMHFRTEIKLFVYRLNYSNGKLEVKSLDDLTVHKYDRWWTNLEEQPVADMTAGDFDGDGKDEIAVLYKRPWKATALKNDKGWSEGPMVGDVNCRVYSWNANGRYFDYAETAKDYHSERLQDDWYDDLPEAWVSGVVGLRAVAADLDGDGKSEIATILLGYVHHKKWDAKIKAYSLRWDDFTLTLTLLSGNSTEVRQSPFMMTLT